MSLHHIAESEKAKERPRALSDFLTPGRPRSHLPGSGGTSVCERRSNMRPAAFADTPPSVRGGEGGVSHTHASWGQILLLALASGVVLGKSLDLSAPRLLTCRVGMTASVPFRSFRRIQ